MKRIRKREPETTLFVFGVVFVIILLMGLYYSYKKNPEYNPPAILSEQDELLDYIWFRESSRGQNPKCRKGIVGPAGERGQYQITPIFKEDVERIGNFIIDEYNPSSCRDGIIIWMNYYAPRVGAKTVAEKYELYRRGPSGYKKWKMR